MSLIYGAIIRVLLQKDISRKKRSHLESQFEKLNSRLRAFTLK